jgi:hypothetical protein
MTFADNPLTGLRVGISISESDDLAAHGFTPSGMNRLTVRFNDALLGEGATLAFGHDWREAGIMDAICSAALSSFGVPQPDAPRPLILNLIPWPDKTRVEEEILVRLNGILGIREAGLPDDLKGFERRADEDPELKLYLRSRGLTHLRRQLTVRSRARVCIGGKEHRFQGRYPGILEEALLTLREGQAVYFVGLLGGAAEQIGRAVLYGQERPPSFGEAPFHATDGCPPLAEIYRKMDRSPSGNPLADTNLDLEGAWRELQSIGAENLSKANGLYPQENRRLLESPHEEEAISLVLRGLRRLGRRG